MITLLCVARIPSSAQILVYKGDTLSCYTDKEMNKITKASERVIELDTLLKSCERSERYLLTQIEEYEEIRLNKDGIIAQKDNIIEGRDNVIAVQEDEITKLKKEVRRQKVWKVIGTGVFAITTVVFIIL